MSELNRALSVAYRLGANDRHMRALSTNSAYRIHRYLLDVAIDTVDTYTGIDEAAQLLGVAYSTAYRVIHSLNRLGLLDCRQGPPHRRDGSHGPGGKGKSLWRAKL